MDNKRLEDKLDKIVDDISEIMQTMAANTSSLEEHIRRTDIAESRINDVELELTPLKAHVAFVKGAAWSMGILGATLLGLSQMGILQKLF